jgi:NAD(P)-dependent dehydrogenase (short-subunit alcohol dehydrogenase family)
MVDFGFATEGRAVVAAFPEQIKGRTCEHFGQYTIKKLLTLVVLITGASKESIGAETAVTLAHGSPAAYLLLGRALDKIQPVIDEIKTADSSITVKFYQVDLDSLASVRSVAQTILDDSSVSKIDVMVNNAGIMSSPYGKTKDGLEMQFGVNHISHFLLTNLLMPKILSAGPGARVVNISSYGNIMSDIRYEDNGFQGGKTYNPWVAYGQSKTANILMAVSLNKKLDKNGIRAYAVNPGSQFTSFIRFRSLPANTFLGVPSQLRRHLTPESLKQAMEISQRLQIKQFDRKTPQQGCSTPLRAMLDPTLPSQSNQTVIMESIANNYSQMKRASTYTTAMSRRIQRFSLHMQLTQKMRRSCGS